jgi:predicted ArsR family transcriptional regulator
MDRSLTPTEFSSAVTAITSAFGDPTRRQIYLFVRDRSDDEGGVTAGEVADTFTLHPNVARHHLDKLVGGGYVEVATGRTSAGAGRPSKRYRVSTPDMALELPVRQDELVTSLLGRALALLPADTAEAMAEDVGLQYGLAMARAMGGTDPADAEVLARGQVPRSFRAALHVVADALTAHGFAAHAEGKGNGLQIVSDHCPFGDAAIEHPVLCAVDRGLVRGMLSALYGDAKADTSSSRPMGDDKCVTSITG